MAKVINVLLLTNYNDNGLLRTCYIIWKTIEKRLIKDGYSFVKYYNNATFAIEVVRKIFQNCHHLQLLFNSPL